MPKHARVYGSREVEATHIGLVLGRRQAKK